jgi:hypothetical protein
MFSVCSSHRILESNISHWHTGLQSGIQGLAHKVQGMREWAHLQYIELHCQLVFIKQNGKFKNSHDFNNSMLKNSNFNVFMHSCCIILYCICVLFRQRICCRGKFCVAYCVYCTTGTSLTLQYTVSYFIHRKLNENSEAYL